MAPSQNTAAGGAGRLALLWRGDAVARAKATARNNRLSPIFDALAAVGVAAEPAVYSEEAAEAVRTQLREVDGVLVWVDPISDGRTRGQLDELLREAATAGVWVSAHPEVILKMGVKEVLHRTRTLGWGVDTRLYATSEAFRDGFPAALGAGPRVVKQNRGNGGQGVWRVELAHAGHGPVDPSTDVRVLHARRDSVIEALRLGEFFDRCEVYFEGGRRIIDQPFQARLPEGMVRCYLSGERVVGFGRQRVTALMPPPPMDSPPEDALPGPRLMSGADYPPLRGLRARMEDEWVPAMLGMLEIEPADLPAIWDADFLYGEETAAGEETWVLCEINVSAVLPIPDEAPAAIARFVARRLTSLGPSGAANALSPST